LVFWGQGIWDPVFHVMEVNIFCKMIGKSAVRSKIYEPGLGQI